MDANAPLMKPGAEVKLRCAALSSSWRLSVSVAFGWLNHGQDPLLHLPTLHFTAKSPQNFWKWLKLKPRSPCQFAACSSQRSETHTVLDKPCTRLRLMLRSPGAPRFREASLT